MIGLEPITCWLQISCSANWATSAHSLISLSRVTPTGIEPVLPPWKGDVLTAWPWSRIIRNKKNSPSRTWTYDTSVNSRMLYRLSYWGLFKVLYTFKTSYISKRKFVSLCSLRRTTKKQFILLKLYNLHVSFLVWLSLRPISNSQLHALLHFHLCPIYLIVSQGSYLLIGGEISSWGGLHA